MASDFCTLNVCTLLWKPEKWGSVKDGRCQAAAVFPCLLCVHLLIWSLKCAFSKYWHLLVCLSVIMKWKRGREIRAHGDDLTRCSSANAAACFTAAVYLNKLLDQDINGDICLRTTPNDVISTIFHIVIVTNYKMRHSLCPAALLLSGFPFRCCGLLFRLILWPSPASPALHRAALGVSLPQRLCDVTSPVQRRWTRAAV